MFYRVFFLCLAFSVRSTRPEGAIDDPCTIESTGLTGTCKLLLNCQKVRDEVVLLHRLPQTCSFRGTQPIVCCPIDEKRQPGVISKIKCKKYSSLSIEGCGQKTVKRIVGEVASPKEFPHMAVVEIGANENDIRFTCGGSIISEEYILTIASCSRVFSGIGPMIVKVGITNLDEEEHMQKFRVTQSIVHPNFDINPPYNNIGLIKLDKRINFNSYARPACLYLNSKILPEKAIATGWGKTKLLGGHCKDMMKYNLDILDYDSCKANCTPKNIAEKSQFCTGGQSNVTCQYDTGGPLQIYHEGDDITCMYDIVGLPLNAIYCGQSPKVYTRVSHYIQWIEDVVWPESV